MRDTYWAWVAGIIDGEGSLVIGSGGRTSAGNKVAHPRLLVTNTEYAIIDKLAESGGNVNGPYTPSRSAGNPLHRPAWRWAAGVGWLRANGRSVLPFMTSKRERMELFLNTIEAGGGTARWLLLKETA